MRLNPDLLPWYSIAAILSTTMGHSRAVLKALGRG